MEVEKKKEYSKPNFSVFRIRGVRPLLTMSGEGVSLQGAGVDENDAEDNGTNIWGN